ncbi:DUF6668 family protein [Herbiconiux daphne]|uniref:Uncharacterized protein n=1 Tax=Herbiconiux daphne TaxID=2970914 RepID=A0ABT2H7A2_9MICO|nr:DUF6668 family protein [Herbiconiux daphne]MCS5735777.1 hypothetical protein [Herbiconiux daphne]
MTNVNPWLVSPKEPAAEVPEAQLPKSRRDVRGGATAPQLGVPAPDTADRLPRREQAWPATAWWLGVHGGAGESTLATLASGTRPADHSWPIPITPGTTHRVVLVARSNFAGITAAQRAATEWASNALGEGVGLAGLVLIADAPGRLPKPLRELEHIVAGGVPRVWHLPWVDAWRVGPIDAAAQLPKEFRQLFTDLAITTLSTSAHH